MSYSSVFKTRRVQNGVRGATTAVVSTLSEATTETAKRRWDLRSNKIIQIAAERSVNGFAFLSKRNHQTPSLQYEEKMPSKSSVWFQNANKYIKENRVNDMIIAFLILIRFSQFTLLNTISDGRFAIEHFKFPVI